MNSDDIKKDVEKGKKALQGKGRTITYEEFIEGLDPLGNGEGLPEKYHKYEHTINDKNEIFFKWSNGLDSETEKDFKKYKIFDVPEPIEWYCSKVPTGETKQVQMPTRDEPITINETTDSGYVKPKFRFIGIRRSGVRDLKEEYKKGLDLFGLCENEEVSPDVVSSISNYKDTLHKQLQRQIEKIKEIDHEIKRILKVFYHETKQNIVREEYSELTEEQRDQRGEAWKKLINGINHLYYVISVGENADRVESHRVFKNEFAEDIITESTIYGVTKLVEEKQPYLDVAENIARRIRPLDSVLEDAILGNKIANAEEYKEQVNEDISNSSKLHISSDWMDPFVKKLTEIELPENKDIKKLFDKEYPGFKLEFNISDINSTNPYFAKGAKLHKANISEALKFIFEQKHPEEEIEADTIYRRYKDIGYW